MGTRHMQRVITKEGDIKVDNYGQWDGYPDGQGKDILKFLRECDLEKYNEMVSKLREATQEDFDLINQFVDEVKASIKNKHVSFNEENDLYKTNPLWYGLHRDCGSDIHQLIYDGVLPIVQLDGEDGYRWSEWDYVIDLQKRVFNIKGHDFDETFDLDNLPTEEEFLNKFKEEEIED